ncbi:MAG: glycoside hydrolase family 15 protein, partial [Thermoplasmata archaeon]
FFKRYPFVYRPVHKYIINATQTRGFVNYGVIGNRSMLATIDAYGTVTNIYWPSIGEKQHVNRINAWLGIRRSNKIFTNEDDRSSYIYLPFERWRLNTYYTPRGLVLRTEGKSNKLGSAVVIRDFVDIEYDVLVRQYTIQNRRRFEKVDMKFIFAEKMHINEQEKGDIVEKNKEKNCILHGKDDAWFAIGCDCMADVLVDKEIEERLSILRKVKNADGCLVVDLANVLPSGIREFSFFICAGKKKEDAIRTLDLCREISAEKMRLRTVEWWENWRPDIGIDVKGTSKRLLDVSAKILGVLYDEKEGSMIASPMGPDMPDYRYIWARDSTYASVALDLLGKHEESRKFYETFCNMDEVKRKGRIEQRYRANWKPAPTFGVQLDQAGTLIWGIYVHYKLTNDIQCLRRNLTEIKTPPTTLLPKADGLPERTIDLWEEYKSNHVYTFASAYGGLFCASEILDELNDEEKEDFLGGCIRYEKMVNRFWNGRYFIKSLNPKIEHVDASALGLALPFGMIPVYDERIVSTAEKIEEIIRYSNGGIGRFEHDSFYGGNPWIITTAWLGMYYALLGKKENAQNLIRWVESSALPDTFLLPEQIDREENSPVSAVPLNWSHAMYVISINVLNGNVPFVKYIDKIK